jgi:heptosyltransferase II
MLVIKTGALGDVLRTTSVLRGLAQAHAGLDVTWITAPAARPLVERHPCVNRVVLVDPTDSDAVCKLGETLASEPFDWVLSLDDEQPLCELATTLAAASGAKLSGAFAQGDTRTYSGDVAAWFDMGLLSKHGKEEADRRKLANRRSHPEIYATMLGVEAGLPELPLTDHERAVAVERLSNMDLVGPGPVVGLNTGAGGRWANKAMPTDEVVDLLHRVHNERGGRVQFLLLGGAAETDRNRAILERARVIVPGLKLADSGGENSLTEFASLIDACQLLVTTDSMALHVGLARGVRLVAVFAPTSPTEIDVGPRGEKIVSLTRDAGSYRPDADNSTLTGERVAEAVQRSLGHDFDV